MNQSQRVAQYISDNENDDDMELGSFINSGIVKQKIKQNPHTRTHPHLHPRPQYHKGWRRGGGDFAMIDGKIFFFAMPVFRSYQQSTLKFPAQ